MDKEKKIGKEHLRRCIEGMRNDFNQRLNHLEELLNIYDLKNQPGKQSRLPNTTKPQHITDIEQWLLKDRNFKTYTQFEQWLTEKGPDSIIAACYNKTYRRHDIFTICDVAKDCLPIVEVVSDE